MDFQPVLIEPRRAAMHAACHWDDRTILDYLRPIVDSYRGFDYPEGGRSWRQPFRDLELVLEIWNRVLAADVAPMLAVVGPLIEPALAASLAGHVAYPYRLTLDPSSVFATRSA